MPPDLAALPGRAAAAEAETFAGLLDTLYAGIGTHGWQDFVDGLSDAYGGALVTMGLRDTIAQRTWTAASSAGDDGHIARYEAYYSGVDDWAPHSAQHPIGQVAISDALVPPSQFVRGEFYTDWCRPAGIDVGVCALLQREGARVMGVSVLLPRRAYEADPHAVDRLHRLLPHMLRAAQMERQLHGHQTRAQTAEGALAGLGVATLLCDAAAQPVFENPAAETLLALGDGVVLRGGRLDAVLAAEGRALRALIASAAGSRAAGSVAAGSGAASGAGGVMSVGRRDGRPAYEVLVAPAPAFRGGLSGGRGTARAVVFVRDPLLREAPKVAQLRQLYGLTAAEARLLQSLLGGASLEQATLDHALSRETLRTQLRGLFRKLDVGSQRELVLRCGGSLAGLHLG